MLASQHKDRHKFSFLLSSAGLEDRRSSRLVPPLANILSSSAPGRGSSGQAAAVGPPATIGLRIMGLSSIIVCRCVSVGSVGRLGQIGIRD